MGHIVHYFDYPEKCDRKAVQASCDHLAAMDDWEEGCSGLNQDIRWLDKEPICTSHDEAEERIKELDNGWYDQLAIRYYEAKEGVNTHSKAYENAVQMLENASKSYDELKKKLHEAFFNRKSEYVGCKECGSKLSIKYLSKTNCPLCGRNLLSETDTDRLMKADQRRIEAMKRVTTEDKKDSERIARQAKNRQVRWLVKIEYHV